MINVLTKDKIVDPFDFHNKRCWAKLALKIESIFIWAKFVSLQVKVYEVLLKPHERRKSLSLMKKRKMKFLHHCRLLRSCVRIFPN